MNKNKNEVIQVDCEDDYRLVHEYNFSNTAGTCSTSLVDKSGKHMYIVTWDGCIVVLDLVNGGVLS